MWSRHSRRRLLWLWPCFARGAWLFRVLWRRSGVTPLCGEIGQERAHVDEAFLKVLDRQRVHVETVLRRHRCGCAGGLPGDVASRHDTDRCLHVTIVLHVQLTPKAHRRLSIGHHDSATGRRDTHRYVKLHASPSVGAPDPPGCPGSLWVGAAGRGGPAAEVQLRPPVGVRAISLKVNPLVATSCLTPLRENVRTFLPF